MIDQLIRDIAEAKASDRRLDCRLHEVLTGQMNECKDVAARSANEEHGRMLLDIGSQCLWRAIPHYTGNADEANGLVAERFAIQITRNPPDVRAARSMHGDDFMGAPWAMTLWDPVKNEMVALATHETMALCICALALAYANTTYNIVVVSQ